MIGRADQYSNPVLIVHGELDSNVFYKTNAIPLFEKAKSLDKDFTLQSFPNYGHGLSPMKNDLPTLGPIQNDAVSVIVDWVASR